MALVKANISNSLRGSALEWYTGLNHFDRSALNNDPMMNTWIKTLSRRFKICPFIALGLLVDERFSLADVRRRRPPAQYVKTIVRYCVGSSVVDEANQLRNAYRNLARELKPFIKPPADSTTASNFIKAFEEKQGIWFSKFQIRPAPQPSLSQSRLSHSCPRPSDKALLLDI